ncbi:MAG: hypothetical protein ACRDOB_02835 [Streptosporangiaceae bacterium]
MQNAPTDISPVRLPVAVGEVVLAAEELRHGQANAATGGIWRVRGPAGSAILKVARLPAGADAEKPFSTSDEPSHWNYWQREALAYQTGLAGSAYAAAGITAPAVLGVDRRPGGGVELWLSDVPGAGGFDWPPARLGRFGYELGTGQARWAGRVPDTAWLSRRWLAQYMARGPSWVGPLDDAVWDHPYLAPWPRQVRRQLRLLWTERDGLLARAEAAERTLCHLDVWPANLVDDEGTSVLLDWSFTGEGAIGEDAANLIIDCFTDGLMDMALLAEVAEAVTDGYLSGLRDGGWAGSADGVRTAIAACAAAKYSWFGPAMAARAARDDLGKSSYRQDTSAAAAIRRLTPLVTLIADLATAALPG